MNSKLNQRIWHIYPYWIGGPTPATDLIESDVWDDLREITTDLNDTRNVMLVPGFDYDKQRILEILDEGIWDDSHACIVDRTRVARSWRLPDGTRQEIDKDTPYDIRSLACQRGVAATFEKLEVKGANNALVVFLEEEDPTDPPFDLSTLFKLCPELTVYIFHLPSEDKCGVYVGVDEVVNWQDEFPPLNSLLHKDMEIIVDKWLVRGGIHVWAGLFESCKTMALIELSDAILSFDPARTDNRKAFEYFEVHARYDVMLLEADMDMAQFDDYARPFNLRRHGNSFRVNRPDSDILRGLDDPLLQSAVNGRILAIDTMLDYARIQRAFESGEWITFFQKVRALINAHGCIAVVMLVHPTKTGARSTKIEPTEFLKDSITFGGKIDAGMAFSPMENGSEIFIQPIKGRAFKGDKRGFTIMHHGNDGENYFDMGRFPICKNEEEAGKREDHSTVAKPGPKGDPQRGAKIEFWMTMEGGVEEKLSKLNAKLNSEHPLSTIKTWLARERDERRQQLRLEEADDVVTDKTYDLTREAFNG